MITQDPRPSSILDLDDTRIDDQDEKATQQRPQPTSTSDPLTELCVSTSDIDLFVTPALAATMSSILDAFYRNVSDSVY